MCGAWGRGGLCREEGGSLDTGRRWTPRVQLWGRGRVRAPVCPLASALTPAWQSPQSPRLLTTGSYPLLVLEPRSSGSGVGRSAPLGGSEGQSVLAPLLAAAPLGLLDSAVSASVFTSPPAVGFCVSNPPTCLFLGFGPTVIRRAWSIASATTLFPDTVTVPILRGPALERGSPPFNLLHPLSSRRRGRWVVAGNASCRGVTRSSLGPDLGQELDLQTSAS